MGGEEEHIAVQLMGCETSTASFLKEEEWMATPW